jgi:hypothetical protein
MGAFVTRLPDSDPLAPQMGAFVTRLPDSDPLAPRSGQRVRVTGPVPPLRRACLIRGFRRICRR